MRDVDGFISRSGWEGARRERLVGDASRRRYERIRRDDASAVLMICPRHDESLPPFVDMTARLRDAGLSAPRILASDLEAGLLLLEDLGDDLYARVTEADPELQETLLTTAADVIVEVGRLQAPHLPRPDTDALLSALDPARDWVPGVDTRAFDLLKSNLRTHLDRVTFGPSCVSLRDFHAGNLIWLPDRDGTARVGLLDYQDAFRVHPAYDLVSLLIDVRQSYPADLVERVAARFAGRIGADAANFHHAFATLTVQRNLRILGVFCRLATRDGKRGYLQHLDTTWRSISAALDHPDLADCRAAFAAAVPSPDAAAVCPTDPALP